MASSQTSLYEQDFLLWIEETATHLKARDFEHLDIDNLIEEIVALGRSERRELKSRLRVLFAHLLKRIYIDSAYNNRGWELTIQEQRNELRELLQQSPSLRNYFREVFSEVWQEALQQVCCEYAKVSFPPKWEFSQNIDEIIAINFWDN